jgi:hypothetical protein
MEFSENIFQSARLPIFVESKTGGAETGLVCDLPSHHTLA